MGHIQRRLFHYSTLSLLVVGCVTPAIALSQLRPNEPKTAPASSGVFRPVLQLGSQGADVTELQAVLKLLGYHEGAIDGFYGATTGSAVSRFQQAAGLSQDGIAGAATWNRLFPPDRTDTLTAEVPTNFPSPRVDQTRVGGAATPKAAQPSTIEFPVLKRGVKGSAVARLQERLKAIGVFGGTIDGVFGAETQLAVKAAQAKFQLETDGIVGAATWSALMR